MNMNDKFYEANLKATTARYTPLRVRPIDHTASAGNVITDSDGRTTCNHCRRAYHTESTCWAKYPHLSTRVGKESFHPRKQGGKNGSKRQKVKTVKTDKIDMSGTTSSLTNAVLNVKSFQVVSLFSYTFLSFETTAVPTTL